MAREHANIRLDMWSDVDWRSLTRDAQWLYELLLTHPNTNRAGVSDWRPGRLSKMAAGTTASEVRAAATELESKHFVVIDEDTEEILIRSYVKYDGVLKQPNLSVTMANDWGGVASPRLRAVVAFEVQKLRVTRPEWPVWEVEKLRTLLSSPALNVRTGSVSDPSIDPSIDPTPDTKSDPSTKGQPDPSVEGPPTSTATSTATSSSAKKTSRSRSNARATLLPDDWEPTESHHAFAQRYGLDVEFELGQFRAHAESVGRQQVSWNGAFTTWLGTAVKRPGHEQKSGRKLTNAERAALDWQEKYGSQGSAPALGASISG